MIDYSLKILVWEGEDGDNSERQEDLGRSTATGECITPNDWGRFGDEIDVALVNSGLYLGLESRGALTSRLYLMPGTCSSAEEASHDGTVICIDLDTHKLEQLALIVNAALSAHKLYEARLYEKRPE